MKWEKVEDRSIYYLIMKKNQMEYSFEEYISSITDLKHILIISLRTVVMKRATRRLIRRKRQRHNPRKSLLL